MAFSVYNITHNRSIQIKIGTILVVLTTIVLAGYGVYQYVTLRSNNLTRLNDLADGVIARLTENLTKPIWEGDDIQVEKVVLAEMHEKNIFAIQVTDDKGNLLTHKGRDPQWQVIAQETLPSGDVISRQADVAFEGRLLGNVNLVFTKQFLYQDLQDAVKTLVVAVLALDAILLFALALSVRHILVRPLASLLDMANTIKTGDFSQDMRIRQRDEIGTLFNAFQEMQVKIGEVVRNVKASAQDLAQRSREMSVAAEHLSEGATQQAAASEQVSSSTEEMAATIRQTADNAKLTENMALTSANDARAGNQAVMEIVKAMAVIADRISVIQEIASQTNMLSLNASIEASKAQEYGKGFTVVASSVRDLARQSRAAADEIRGLVQSCVTLSAQAGDILQRLTPNTENTAELVQEICAASQEQSTGVEHINQAVQQLDQVTQQTAATAEQVAVTAEHLTTQAETLQNLMAFFTVKEFEPLVQAQDDDVQQLLQDIPKDRLLALLSAAISEKPGAPHKTPKSSAHAARDHRRERRSDALDTRGDDLDLEFEHF